MLQNFVLFCCFLIRDILRPSLAAVTQNIQKVLSKISEALLKGAMCCVFKHQYVIVKLIVTPWYNYHKQMRQRFKMIGCPCLTPPLLMLVFIKIKTTFPINLFAYNISTLVQGLHVAISITVGPVPVSKRKLYLYLCRKKSNLLVFSAAKGTEQRTQDFL